MLRCTSISCLFVSSVACMSEWLGCICLDVSEANVVAMGQTMVCALTQLQFTTVLSIMQSFYATLSASTFTSADKSTLLGSTTLLFGRLLTNAQSLFTNASLSDADVRLMQAAAVQVASTMLLDETNDTWIRMAANQPAEQHVESLLRSFDALMLLLGTQVNPSTAANPCDYLSAPGYNMISAIYAYQTSACGSPPPSFPSFSSDPLLSSLSAAWNANPNVSADSAQLLWDPLANARSVGSAQVAVSFAIYDSIHKFMPNATSASVLSSANVSSLVVNSRVVSVSAFPPVPSQASTSSVVLLTLALKQPSDGRQKMFCAFWNYNSQYASLIQSSLHENKSSYFESK